MKYFPTRPFIFAIAILPFFCNCGKKEKPLAYSDRQWLMLDTTDNHTKNVDSLLVLVKNTNTPATLNDKWVRCLSLGMRTGSRVGIATP